MAQKSITIQISEESAKQLAKIAKDWGKTEIEVITEAVDDFIGDNYEGEEDYTPSPPDLEFKARMDEVLKKMREKKAAGG